MKIKYSLFVILLLSSGLISLGVLKDLPLLQIKELPYKVKAEEVKPLRQLVNKDLQKALEKQLNKNVYWKKLIKSKKMAVGVVDLSNPYNVKFARVNGNEMMYAASLPKIAILLAAEQTLEDGMLQETEEIKGDMKIMISRSDNQAATRMIDRLGYDRIEEVLTDQRYNFYDEESGGGLWVGKRFASLGVRHPDPIKGLSHAATVSQVCRFYYMLAFGQLVSFERSKDMLNIMTDPELHHKFVGSIEKLAPNAKLYRKSGTWLSWHADSILVWGEKWRRYILVALVQDENGERIMRNLLPAVDEILKPAILK
ncbi:MAG: class A beta-lactamase-related serine hydrolase [Bacteroidetes bacterium]|nr:class A beta-lactamase-related serine hydrolase [Bacteroidota bacterium]MBU2507987.1 class A beta-lactamase-related serine hydrolase [Bacteroidota bacterium]